MDNRKPTSIALSTILIANLTVFALAYPPVQQAEAQSIDVIWYGSSIQNRSVPGVNDAVVHLQNLDVHVEKRNSPVSNLADAKLVVIAPINFCVPFSTSEVTELTNYVKNGGHLIFAVDTEYAHCIVDSLCSPEVSRNFGFGFDGDVQFGTITAAEGQSTHPIWTTPNTLSLFENWCCDAFVRDILDSTNVKVLARVSGESFEFDEGFTFVNNVAAIVVNEDPVFKGGKVLGAGYNMFVGLDGDFRLFDNIIAFMLAPSNNPPDCGKAAPSEAKLLPPNHKMMSITITKVTDPDGDPIRIKITGIKQDEPTSGQGEGDKSPDGTGVGTSTAQVRAERDGNGDGRVYHVLFRASDGKGGKCFGEVLVSVPKNQNAEAIDQGALFVSTV